MRRHPTVSIRVARISVAISGIDFTAPEVDFAALIRESPMDRPNSLPTRVSPDDLMAE